MHVLNAHSPSVSMIFDQLEVISGGTCPAFFNRAIHAVSCARICPVTYIGYPAGPRNEGLSRWIAPIAVPIAAQSSNVRKFRSRSTPS